MDSNEKTIFQQIKEIDLVEYLASQGHHPAKKYNGYYMYRSPLRSEHTASFKVDLRANLWVDYGESQANGKFLGGDSISLIKKLHNLDDRQLAAWFTGNHMVSSNQQQVKRERPEETGPKITVVSDIPLYSYVLKNYLDSRAIPRHIADRFCREVNYETNGRRYYGIGFKNSSGGWEIRNPGFKGSTAPKGPTYIDNGSTQAAVFEGFTDFLSYMTIYENKPESRYNFVILNSAVFFNQARDFLEKHQAIHLYFDQDAKGRKITAEALAIDSSKYIDESSFYKEGKDLNKWHAGQPRQLPVKIQRRHGL